MPDRWAEAIPNPLAVAVVAPSLRVVLPVIPSRNPAVGVSPALVVLVLEAVVVPNPAGSPSDPASAPRLDPDNSSIGNKRSRRPDRYAESDNRRWLGRLELWPAT
jgi:hypothetical protein